MRGLVKRVDTWITASGGPGKRDLRSMLYGLRRELNDALATGEPRLRAVNPGLRELGEARRLLDDRIAKEMASTGTKPAAGSDLTDTLLSGASMLPGVGRLASAARLGRRLTR